MREELTLYDLIKGDKAKVTGYKSIGQKSMNKLYAFGILPNTPIEIYHVGRGPREIYVRNTRIGIGKGLSKKVYVKKV